MHIWQKMKWGWWENGHWWWAPTTTVNLQLTADTIHLAAAEDANVERVIIFFVFLILLASLQIMYVYWESNKNNSKIKPLFVFSVSTSISALFNLTRFQLFVYFTLCVFMQFIWFHILIFFFTNKTLKLVNVFSDIWSDDFPKIKAFIWTDNLIQLLPITWGSRELIW